MKIIKDISELVAWDKVYLVQDREGVTKMCHWTPKHNDEFSTAGYLANQTIPYEDCDFIIELCESGL